MRNILTLLLFLTCYLVNAQNTISLKDIDKHVGDSITVTGKVFSVRYLENAKGAPTGKNTNIFK